MIGLLLVGFVDWTRENGKLKIRLNPAIGQNLLNPTYFTVTFFFLIVFLSGWQTDDWHYWFERLRIKLPFLILPFAFAGLPTFYKKQYESLVYFLLILLVITCIGIGINYTLHFDVINESIKHGKAVPTPCNHIRFSLLLSLGILGGSWLSWKQFYRRFQWEKWFIRISTGFLFGFIFLLTVRSGLVALYGALLVLLFYYVYVTKRYLKATLITGALIAMPLIAYFFFPTFNAKVGYVKEDLAMHQQGKGENYSDSGRLTSILIGLQIARDHFPMGVGAGNLQKEVEKIYARDYPNAPEVKLPHNQFVWVFASTGLAGLLLFCAAFFYPLLYNEQYRQPIFLAFYAIIFSSFLTESTLETSLGVGLYLFFLLLSLNYMAQYCPQPNLRSWYERLPRQPNLVR